MGRCDTGGDGAVVEVLFEGFGWCVAGAEAEIHVRVGGEDRDLASRAPL